MIDHSRRNRKLGWDEVKKKETCVGGAYAHNLGNIFDMWFLSLSGTVPCQTVPCFRLALRLFPAECVLGDQKARSSMVTTLFPARWVSVVAGLEGDIPKTPLQGNPAKQVTMSF